jgi:AraC-like DNA-binding protein
MRPQFESIAPLETNSFKAFIQVKKEFDAPYHYHPEYELTHILSSDGVRYVGNEFQNFAADDLVLLGPNLPHCWKNSDEQTSTASAVVIQWKEDLLGKEWLDTKEFTAIKKLHHLSARGIKFSEKIANAIKPEIQQIVSLDPLNKLLKLVDILDKLSRTNDFSLICKDDFTHQINSTNHERINQIYHFVKTNYSKKITLGNAAAIVCMTEESFSRFFSKVMKKTFFSFLNEYRINVACKLLIESDIPITQVCYHAGYETVPFFYRQFKKFKKCSPQFYRSQFKLTGNFEIPAN